MYRQMQPAPRQVLCTCCICCVPELPSTFCLSAGGGVFVAASPGEATLRPWAEHAAEESAPGSGRGDSFTLDPSPQRRQAAGDCECRKLRITLNLLRRALDQVSATVEASSVAMQRLHEAVLVAILMSCCYEKAMLSFSGSADMASEGPRSAMSPVCRRSCAADPPHLVCCFTRVLTWRLYRSGTGGKGRRRHAAAGGSGAAGSSRQGGSGRPAGSGAACG